jgi:arylsulfatase A-like enzyme/predicted TPR repeat methyltransferase
MTRPAVCLLALSFVSVIASCDASRRADSGDDVSTVLLVSIDTWRRDATGFLGQKQPSPTPFIDQLAKEALVATDAVAPVPVTGPSHWSMMTGRWPWRDSLRTNGDAPSEEHAPTLAQRLRREGWQTAAFISSVVLDHRFGFAAGFDHFDDRISRKRDLEGAGELAQRRGDRTVASAIDWLGERDAGQRIFLWLHLFDAHYPYDAPTGPLAGEHGDYLAEVAFADRQVRTLMEWLEQNGRSLDRSIVAILADHGEGLGEHDEPTHGLLLHGATTRIPLLVVGHSVRAGTFDSPTSTVDVFPTILGALGLSAPPNDGRDLLSSLPDPDRSIPLESLFGLRSYGLSPVYGLRTRQWLMEKSPQAHLWNLANDPDEATDLASSNPDTVDRLTAIRSEIGMPPAAPPAVLAPDLVEQLQALGYVSGAHESGVGDVREFVTTDRRRLAEINSLQEQNQLALAETKVMEFLERYPGAAEAWFEAGFIAARSNDINEAERRFRRASELDRTSTKAHLNLGNALLLSDRLEEAEQAYRTVLEIDHEDYFALFNLGLVLERQKRYTEAASIWSEFLRIHPDDAIAAKVGAKLRRWKASGGRIR